MLYWNNFRNARAIFVAWGAILQKITIFKKNVGLQEVFDRFSIPRGGRFSKTKFEFTISFSKCRLGVILRKNTIIKVSLQLFSQEILRKATFETIAILAGAAGASIDNFRCFWLWRFFNYVNPSIPKEKNGAEVLTKWVHTLERFRGGKDRKTH